MIVQGAILAAVGFVLILHRILEKVLCNSGNRVKRKFVLEMSTAGTLALGWIVMLVLTMLIPEWRAQFLGLVSIATPFILGGILFFSYLSFIVYFQDTEKSEYRENESMVPHTGTS